ncbi:hypothetical protein K402DRAFT_439197 [Aulographum hederae CBS 113979]|uniref:Integral membrane protein n=1 Tax=Aulographum hederae CBS 113979 TaxID=1176131 RepID=A0A6G1GLL7_9PEZI|nr:hypothetical protein K402DRAFT_439197 [Aulographum hederae CBS 113979]
MSAASAADEFFRRHPLQRVESPSRGLSFVLHLFGLASYAYSFAYLVLNPNPVNDSYGWHFQYLTILGLSLATGTFIMGLIADITLSPRIFAYKNALSVASTPMEVVISILYWGLRLIDERLVLPTWAPPIATTADLSFHLIPSLLLTLDLLLFSPPYSITFLPTSLLSLAIAFGYWFWVELCFSHNGFYPYPIFAQLSTPWRVVLFAGSAAVFTGSTEGLKGVYGWVNGRGIEEVGVDGRGEVKKGQ